MRAHPKHLIRQGASWLNQHGSMNETALTKTTPKQAQKQSALLAMASRLNVDTSALMDSLKATVFKGASNEELLSLVVVANEHNLNPFTRQIYAFPKKGGGIVPVIPIDGWVAIVNRRPDFDGVQFSWESKDDKPFACTCTMHVRNRHCPVVVTEFFSECFRDTDPWRGMPRRMLRHKAFMQAARLAFGLSGIHDEDEARDIVESLPEARPCVTFAGPTTTDNTNPDLAPQTPQAQLADLVKRLGHTFDQFVQWATESGNGENVGDWDSFDTVPDKVCALVLRAQDGFKASMAQITKK